MIARTLFILLSTLVILLSIDSTSAWQTQHSTSRPLQGKALQFRTGASTEDDRAVMTAAVATALPHVEPKAWDLPRHSPPAAQVRREQLLWDAELVLGRVAMMTAMVLLVEEVTTGLSFSDQLSNFLR